MPPSGYQLPAPSISEIIRGLFIGNWRTILDFPTLQSNNMKAAISMVAAPHVMWHQPCFVEITSHHLWIECVDSSTQDLLRHMTRCCDFVEAGLESKTVLSDQASQADIENPEARKVLVHCEQGISRSATMVIAYRMRKQRRGLEEVLEEVRGKRRRIKPNENFLAQLEVWDKVQYQIWEDEEKQTPKAAYKEYFEQRAVKLKEKGLTGDEVHRPLSL